MEPFWLARFRQLSSRPRAYRFEVECQWEPEHQHTYSAQVTSRTSPGVCVKGSLRALGEVFNLTPSAGDDWNRIYGARNARAAAWLRRQPPSGVFRTGRIIGFVVPYDRRRAARIGLNYWAGTNLAVADCPHGFRCSRH